MILFDLIPFDARRQWVPVIPLAGMQICFADDSLHRKGHESNVQFDTCIASSGIRHDLHSESLAPKRSDRKF